MPTYTGRAMPPRARPLYELLFDTTMPSDWADQSRLSGFERDHADPDGKTWAAYRDEEGIWTFYAPGAPNRDRWPHTAVPYDTYPAAVFSAVECDAAMPLGPGDDNKLRAALARHHGGIARTVTAGIQWSGERSGRLVAYLRF